MTKATAKQSSAKADFAADVDKNAAREHLQAIMESLWRLTGAVQTFSQFTVGRDIGPPCLVSILADAGEEAYGVGDDAVHRVAELLGIDISAREDEKDPFIRAYQSVKAGDEILGRPGVQTS